MSIPKELIADVEYYKTLYDEYLDGKVGVDVSSRVERALEADLGRAGVSNPRHKLEAIRESVKARRLAERQATMSS